MASPSPLSQRPRPPRFPFAPGLPPPPPPPPFLTDIQYTVSDNQVLDSLYFNLLWGGLCVFGFVVLRGWLRGPGGVFQRRQELQDLFMRPPRLVVGGIRQIWNWVMPLLAVSDADIIRCGGFDALVLTRVLLIGLQIFTFMTLFGVGVMIPFYYTHGGLKDTSAAVGDLARVSVANLFFGSNAFLLPFFFTYLFTIYGCMVLWINCKGYVQLRMAYFLCLDALPSEQVLEEGQQQADSRKAAAAGGAGIAGGGVGDFAQADAGASTAAGPTAYEHVSPGSGRGAGPLAEAKEGRAVQGNAGSRDAGIGPGDVELQPRAPSVAGFSVASADHSIQLDSAVAHRMMMMGETPLMSAHGNTWLNIANFFNPSLRLMLDHLDWMGPLQLGASLVGLRHLRLPSLYRDEAAKYVIQYGSRDTLLNWDDEVAESLWGSRAQDMEHKEAKSNGTVAGSGGLAETEEIASQAFTGGVPAVLPYWRPLKLLQHLGRRASVVPAAEAGKVALVAAPLPLPVPLPAQPEHLRRRAAAARAASAAASAGQGIACEGGGANGGGNDVAAGSAVTGFAACRASSYMLRHGKHQPQATPSANDWDLLSRPLQPLLPGKRNTRLRQILQVPIQVPHAELTASPAAASSRRAARTSGSGLAGSRDLHDDNGAAATATASGVGVESEPEAVRLVNARHYVVCITQVNMQRGPRFIERMGALTYMVVTAIRSRARWCCGYTTRAHVAAVHSNGEQNGGVAAAAAAEAPTGSMARRRRTWLDKSILQNVRRYYALFYDVTKVFEAVKPVASEEAVLDAGAASEGGPPGAEPIAEGVSENGHDSSSAVSAARPVQWNAQAAVPDGPLPAEESAPAGRLSTPAESASLPTEPLQEPQSSMHAPQQVEAPEQPAPSAPQLGSQRFLHMDSLRIPRLGTFNMSMPSIQLRRMPGFHQSAAGEAEAAVCAEVQADAAAAESEEDPAGAAVAAVLRDLYPASFQGLVPVSNHDSVDKLIYKWDAKMAQFTAAVRALRLAEANEAPDVEAGSIGGGSGKDGARPQPGGGGCCGGRRRVPAPKMQEMRELVNKLRGEVRELEVQVEKERAQTLSKPLGTAYFAFFNNSQDAQMLSQCQLVTPPQGPGALLSFNASPAPAPDDVSWPNLWRTSMVQQLWRRVGTFFLLCLIFVIPIGALQGALANLDTAVCAGRTLTGDGTTYVTDAGNELYVGWFCDNTTGRLLKSLITGVLPSILGLAWSSFVMPQLLFLCSSLSRRRRSMSGQDREMQTWFFWYSLVNTFLGAVFGGGVFSQIGVYLQNPGEVFNRVGKALPNTANFFVQFVIARAVFTNVLRLLWPHAGAMLGSIFRSLMICGRPQSLMQATRIHMIPSTRAPSFYNGILQVFMFGCAFAVVSPIILPCCWFFFLSGFFVYRYCILYVYERSYESGGLMWPVLFDEIMGFFVLMEVFSAAVLFVNGAFTPAAIMLATLTPPLFVFWRYCRRTFLDPLDHPPLTLVAREPLGVQVDPLVYMPPALRPGALGWYPEQGKVWEQYGIPKYW